MGFLDLLLGKRTASGGGARASGPASSTHFGHSQLTQGAGSVHSVRRDVLRVALRETLTRNGIPPNWVGADMLRTNSPHREPGMHVRLLIRHWEPRLMLYGVAFERDFMHRLLMLDPQAETWLSGFSWQFALEDTGSCPPLPHPGTWMAPAATAQATAPAPLGAPTTRPGGIIEGPMGDPRPLDEVRADLERLLALRDEDLKRHGRAAPDQFPPTRPAVL